MPIGRWRHHAVKALQSNLLGNVPRPLPYRAPSSKSDGLVRQTCRFVPLLTQTTGAELLVSCAEPGGVEDREG